MCPLQWILPFRTHVSYAHLNPKLRCAYHARGLAPGITCECIPGGGFGRISAKGDLAEEVLPLAVDLAVDVADLCQIRCQRDSGGESFPWEENSSLWRWIWQWIAPFGGGFGGEYSLWRWIQRFSANRWRKRPSGKAQTARAPVNLHQTDLICLSPR